MNKSLMLAAALAAVLSFVSMPARATGAPVPPPNYASTASQPGGTYQNTDFVGLDSAVVSGTAASAITSGAALLYAVCPVGAVGAYALGFNTATAPALNTVGLGIVTPMVYSSNNTTSSGPMGPCWNAKRDAGGPVYISSKLYGINSTGALNTVFYFLTVAQLAPAN